MGFIGAKGEENFVNFHRTSFKVRPRSAATQCGLLTLPLVY